MWAHLRRRAQQARDARGTINRIWRQARAHAFTRDVVASPLGQTLYNLRYAGVSLSLIAGVPPSQVAEWVGRSMGVLLQINANAWMEGAEVFRRRVRSALGHGPGAGENLAAYLP